MGSFTLSPLDIALLAVADPHRVAPDDADLALVAEQLGYDGPQAAQAADRRRRRRKHGPQDGARRSRKPPQ